MESSFCHATRTTLRFQWLHVDTVEEAITQSAILLLNFYIGFTFIYPDKPLKGNLLE